MDDTISVTVTHEITRQRIEDVLTCAFEGGVGYWCAILDYINPDNEQVTYRYSQLPLTKNGAVVLTESSDVEDSGQRWILNRKAIEEGLRKLALERPQDFKDILEENMDADTGDNFLQYCLFGELVYG